MILIGIQELSGLTTIEEIIHTAGRVQLVVSTEYTRVTFARAN